MVAKNLGSKFLPILATMILMLVVFATSAFIAIQSGKIKQKKSLSPPVLLTPTLTPNTIAADDSEKVCLENNGKWIAAFRECEGIKREACTKNGGVYEPCASACRHQPKTEVCIQVCVEVCSFGESDPGDPTL